MIGRALAAVMLFAAGLAQAQQPQHPPSDLDWNAFPDLGDLVSGRVAGRSHREQRTFFLNSTGCGAQYAAVGQLILREARLLGLGHELPGEWFTEAVAP